MDTKIDIPQESFSKKASCETNLFSGRPPDVMKSGNARVLAQVLGFKFNTIRYVAIFPNNSQIGIGYLFNSVGGII
jgi:hypothetical protein